LTAPRIVLVTSNHLRHRWLATRLRRRFSLVGIVAEGKPQTASGVSCRSVIDDYFRDRTSAETRWFDDAPDFSLLDAATKEIAWGESNSPDVHRFVTELRPHILVLFGSSIIRDPLLRDFAGRTLNMHLGLSPYYRGSATNFWPLVHGEPECVGVTVHHATLAVDGGNILAQRRPMMQPSDSSHDIGCKAILTGAEGLCEVIAAAGERDLPGGHRQKAGGRLCRRGDFTQDALIQMQRNFRDGMIARYIGAKAERDGRYPIYPGDSV
jgi:folate-dependent phosphoribosylglycinamide formyltransferase PurN